MCPEGSGRGRWEVGEKWLLGKTHRVGPARLLVSFLTLDLGFTDYSPRARSDPVSLLCK